MKLRDFLGAFVVSDCVDGEVSLRPAGSQEWVKLRESELTDEQLDSLVFTWDMFWNDNGPLFIVALREV